MALQFKESQHANDKRKKVQPCVLSRWLRQLRPSPLLSNNIELNCRFILPHALAQTAGAIGISQLHNKSSAFAKSKAVLTGQVGPCCRARVSDLLSLDADRPAGPGQRVLGLRTFNLLHLVPLFLCEVRPRQSAFAFTQGAAKRSGRNQELLEALAEGLDENARKRIYVLDLLPNRLLNRK